MRDLRPSRGGRYIPAPTQDPCWRESFTRVLGLQGRVEYVQVQITIVPLAWRSHGRLDSKLWTSILYRRTRVNEDACGIIRQAIDTIVNEALHREAVQAYKAKYPEIGLILDREGI